MPTVPPNLLPRGQRLNPLAEKPSKDNILMALATMKDLGRLDTAVPGPEVVPPQRGRKVKK